jgi:hypothetical protein
MLGLAHVLEFMVVLAFLAEYVIITLLARSDLCVGGSGLVWRKKPGHGTSGGLAMDQLNWKPVMKVVRQAEGVPGVARQEAGTPIIDGMLRRLFNVDVNDRRQLNYLIQCLGLYTPSLVELALASSAYEFFGLDQNGSTALSLQVFQASAILTLNLSHHLQPEVRSGRLQRERISAPPIDAGTFMWSTLKPDPQQVKRYDAWHRVAAAWAATPGHVAGQDQAAAMLRDLYQYDLLAYMSAVAQYCILALATLDLDPDHSATDGALRFRDVVMVTVYKSLPGKYRELAETN